MKLWLLLLVSWVTLFAESRIELGSDRFFSEGSVHWLKGKNVALVTNQTGVDKDLKLTAHKLIEQQNAKYQVVAIFSPEHGFLGSFHASEKVSHSKLKNIPCYSLHGEYRRPTEKMLKGIDVIIYDIQEIGARSYTYLSTLFYVMEEAAKQGIEVIVLDRPNPMGGVQIDGPMLELSLRSFVGYIDVPYCHGMTVGELAQFFNQEYHIGCKLKVVAMRGWKRVMDFHKTGLVWIPTSPQIPEADTPFYYCATGILGEIELVNIGVGYTLPFKVVGAPWIDADRLCNALNKQKLSGVLFLPFHYKPFFGPYKKEECHGVRIIVTDSTLFQPVTCCYMIMGLLKSLYPKEVCARLDKLPSQKRKMFDQVNGTRQIWELFYKQPYPAWEMSRVDAVKRAEFLDKRKQYLLYP